MAGGGFRRISGSAGSGIFRQKNRRSRGPPVSGGSAGFDGPRPDGVGGVLDGAAAGVERAHEVVAGEAGEFLGAGGFLLGALSPRYFSRR